MYNFRTKSTQIDNLNIYLLKNVKNWKCENLPIRALFLRCASYGISEWNFTDMLNIKGYIFLVRTVTLTFPVHELSALDWSEKWFLTCSSYTIWSIWMKLHRCVDHQRLHIVTKDVISLSISVLLLFRHYISHKITFGAPSSGGVLRSACGAFIVTDHDVNQWWAKDSLTLVVSADRELKIDWTKSSPGNIAFVSSNRELKIDIETLSGFLCIFHR